MVTPVKQRSGLTLGIAITLGATAAKAEPAGQRASDVATEAELASPAAMLWRYTARCALRADQEVEAPVESDGHVVKVKGALGLAPEWRQGVCDRACQEKVSSCLAALTNQTGKHVGLSLLSAAPDLVSTLGANENDLPFPFQEGAFFGNVFEGEAYVCRGRDAAKGEQVKRTCALSPEQCSGVAHFADAGRCEDRCEMSCSVLSDGTSRCAAVACRDPGGRIWSHPITTYMRNRIEAGNADVIVGAVVRDSGLEGFQEGGRATYRAVDFGRSPGTIRAVVASVASAAGGGRIEVWLSGGRRLGVLPVRGTGGAPAEIVAPLRAQGLHGPHDLVLRFTGLHAGARLADIGLR